MTVHAKMTSVSSYGYDNAGRTTDVWHKTGAGTTLAHYSYVYNAGGDVTSRVDSDGTTTTFGYDASDQLTSEARAGGYSVAYTYDHNHNRLSKTTNGTAEQYTYDAHDKLLTAGAKTYAYDSNGNCTSVTLGSSVTHLSYDVENRVVGITYPNNATNSFAYNGEDLRVRKVDSSGTKNYITDGASPASAVLSDGAAVYTPGLSERRGGASKFYHADALGSTRGITDSSQAVTDSQLYDAFGNTVSRTGTTPTPFGFVGSEQYQTDGDSGLLLLGHRYYDPSIGRFLSSDPAQAGTNWYAYCDNNPLGKTDPEGKCPLLLFVIVVVFVISELPADPNPPGPHHYNPGDDQEEIVQTVDNIINMIQAGASAITGGPGVMPPPAGYEPPEPAIPVGDNFPHYSPNPTGPYPRTRIREGGLSAQTYDGDGYGVTRTDFGSRSGRTDHPFPHHHELIWPVNGRNPKGSPKIGPPVLGLP